MRKLGVLLRETAISEEINRVGSGNGRYAVVPDRNGDGRSSFATERIEEGLSPPIGGNLNARSSSASRSHSWRYWGDCYRQSNRLSKPSFKLIGLSCCGATWGLFRPSNEALEDEIPPLGGSDRRQQIVVEPAGERTPPQTTVSTATTPRSSLARVSSQGMNLAAALEAERRRSEADITCDLSVSFLRLLSETASLDFDSESICSTNDKVCCVCMRREKGSALIPCGHTFCRLCSRDLYLNRGSCALCNRTILDVLDIF